jgi:hypothetical protein
VASGLGVGSVDGASIGLEDGDGDGVVSGLGVGSADGISLGREDGDVDGA